MRLLLRQQSGAAVYNKRALPCSQLADWWVHGKSSSGEATKPSWMLQGSWFFKNLTLSRIHTEIAAFVLTTKYLLESAIALNLQALDD